MRAMILEKPAQPLKLTEITKPEPAAGQVLIKVNVCGLCRTDIHVIDDDLTEPKLPIVPGHQIVGQVEKPGNGVTRFAPGDRVGVPWLGAVAATAHTVNPGGKTCAMKSATPAISLMVASLNTL